MIISPLYQIFTCCQGIVTNQNLQATGSVEVTKEGEVLGVSTTLPATGANTLWLIIALILIISGTILIIGGSYLKLFGIALTLSFMWFAFAGSSLAVDLDNNLSVRLEQPQSPTRSNDWKLSYTVLDRLARTPTITCFVKKPGSASFVQYDSVKVSSKSTGDNGSCLVNSSVLSSGQGDYAFYVNASSGTDSENSPTVTITYDTDGPGRPSWYQKEHPSMCRYIIRFRTADDNGHTHKVEIYSSANTSFNTDSGSRVGTVIIGSNQEGSFTHDRGSDCDKNYYYVIRAFDVAGNQSDYLGDEEVITTTSSPVPLSAPVITSAESSGTILGSFQESQLNDDISTESAGETLGEDVEIVDTNQGILDSLTAKGQSRGWWYLGLGVLLSFIIYYVRRRRQTR